jgi:NADPH:quinone reductase-like Zn-dependent oxidoreductase
MPRGRLQLGLRRIFVDQQLGAAELMQPDRLHRLSRHRTVSATQVRSSGAQLKQLARLLDDGSIRVAIDGTFPLTDARKAHEHAERGHVQGKIVLTVG